MTVINPHKDKKNIISPAILILGVILIALGVIYVFEYNRLVNLSYDIPKVKKEIQEMVVKNSDLRINLDQIISPAQLQVVAQERNLIKEEKPYYFDLKNPLAQLR